jgi:type III restriction enzyme
MPTDVLDRFDGFERGRWYSGWRRSVLPVASFDAKTTERGLAEILDGDSKIRWWPRLQTTDPAYEPVKELLAVSESHHCNYALLRPGDVW